MSHPCYSICIVHYGPILITEECVRSTLALDPSPLKCFLVWNDPDSLPSEINSELSQSLTILNPGENLGYAGGANLGLRAAFEDPNCAALWLLNNDLLVENHTVEPLLGALFSAPDVGAAGPRILERNSGRIWHDGGEIRWPTGRPFGPRLGEDPTSSPVEEFDVEFLCGCAPLIRRQAFETVGGFDERYFLYYEDADLSLRLKDGGWRLLQVPHAHVLHGGSTTTGTTSPLSRYYRLRNRLLFSKEHAPNPAAAARSRLALCWRSRLRAWRYNLVGRREEGRAILAALADARVERWGRRS